MRPRGMHAGGVLVLITADQGPASSAGLGADPWWARPPGHSTKGGLLDHRVRVVDPGSFEDSGHE